MAAQSALERHREKRAIRKGLIVTIFRGGYDSPLNAFQNASKIVVTHVDGEPLPPGSRVSEPTDVMPQAEIRRNVFGNAIVVPFGETHVSFGGTFAASSDSRWAHAVEIYAAIPIHDRIEG